jgi:hypothetical protein
MMGTDKSEGTGRRRAARPSVAKWLGRDTSSGSHGAQKERGPEGSGTAFFVKRLVVRTAEAAALLLPGTLLVPVLPKLLPTLVLVDLRLTTFLE